MSNSANFKIDTRGIVNAAGDEDMATGDIKLWPSEVIPAGWIVRDGRALSRVAYAALFTVLGTRYGAGDGATTFNIPDDRGEFERCADMGRGVDAGRTIGSLQRGTLCVVNTTPADRDVYTMSAKTASSAGALNDISADKVNTAEYGGVVSWVNNGSFNENLSLYPGVGATRPRNRAYVPLIKY